MIDSHTERDLVELPLLAQLRGMGWQTLEGDTDVPALTERDNFRQIYLRDRVRAALLRINPWLDDSRINQAITALEREGAPDLLEANQRVRALLLSGYVIDGLPDLHNGKNVTIHYIDWDHTEQNDFLAINQFRVDPPHVVNNRGYCIPDIVCFVNGIPLVVECKSPYIENPMQAGINDLLFYSNQRADLSEQRGMERLFYPNAFLISTYYDSARVGTVGASARHYLEWKDASPLTDAELAAELGSEVAKISPQQRLVAGMLRPANLLDLVDNFTVFKEDSGRISKIIARYQQFRAVQKAIYRLQHGQTRRQHGQTDQRGGIIWHTQGSGKSLTMVFLVRKMRRLPGLREFKIVVVTDRIDLQKQLSGTATLTDESVHIARNTDGLERELRKPSNDLLFAMIQKVRGDEDEQGEVIPAFGELNSSEQILMIVDEAHRSHTNTMHMNLKIALPNAALIGFTGTPIFRDAKSATEKIFGAFIDTYKLTESVADGATVPILYEGRTANGVIRDENALNREFEDLFHEYTPKEREAIKQKYGAQENVFESEGMIAAKAENMLYHYIGSALPNGLKAMVVASSRRAVVRYVNQLKLAHEKLVGILRGLPPSLLALTDAELADYDELTRFMVQAHGQLERIEQLEFGAVISGGSDDPSDWKPWINNTDRQVSAFKKPFDHANPSKRSGLAFLCVKNMLLTGFDAPVAGVLYLDRSIQNHELLQAIARVNRTYPNKAAGLIVDYYGVAQHLKDALDAYSSDDIHGSMISLADELPRLAEHHRRGVSLFYEQGITLEDEEACVELLADVRIRARFLLFFKQFTESLDTILPRPEAQPYLADARLLGYINLRARNRYRDELLNISDVGAKVQALIDRYVTIRGIDPKIPPIDIMDRAAFDAALAETQPARAKAAEMEHAARYHIDKNAPDDPIYYRKLSERLEAILTHYQERWDEQVAALGEFTDELRQGRRADDTGLDPLRQAPFYRLIAVEGFGAETLDGEQREQLIAFSVNLAHTLRERLKVTDFWRRDAEQSRLRSHIFEQLDQLGVPYDRLAELTDQVMALAKRNHVPLTT